MLSLATARVNAADLSGIYYFAGFDAPAGTLEVSSRREPAYHLLWQPLHARRTHGLGLTQGDLLAAAINTGGAAYGVMLLERAAESWRGQWISSVIGAENIGEIRIEAAALAGRAPFSAHSRAGTVQGTVEIQPRGPAFSLTFSSASGLELYRGVGAVEGGHLAVAWCFGGAPALALYQSTEKGLDGHRFASPRRGVDASCIAERLTRDGADDTIFPPQLPSRPAANP